MTARHSWPVRVAILADLLEEGWASMDLVAGALLHALEAQTDLAVRPALVRPTLLAPPWSSSPSTAVRVLNRFWLYRRALPPAVAADVFHVVDHSYAHLLLHAPVGCGVLTCHDIDAFVPLLDRGADSGLPMFLVRRLEAGLKRAAIVACPSRVTADALAGSGLVPRDRVRVVPNGVDIEPLSPAIVEALTADLLGPIGSTVDVLNVGSTIDRKRVDLLLRVFARLAATRPRLRLVRVGGAFTPVQQALAARLGISGRIAMLPALDRHTLSAVYQRAALLLATSAREGFGLPLAEALAAGTPVVATDLAVFREVAGEAATFVATDGDEAWTVAAGTLLDERDAHPAAWERRQVTARARGSMFSWSRYARDMASLYREVAARRSEPGS